MLSQAALKRFPDTPGVYFFLGKGKKILYIGRATSLRNRIRSYFTEGIAEKRSAWIAKMLTEAKSIDFRKTDSVLEAILLEADLIKKFQPTYNTDEKDDKSFNCVVITKEAFPAIFIARQRDIDFSSLTAKSYKLKAVYGPFTNGFQLQTAMKIIRRIFPYRDAKCIPLHADVRGLKKTRMVADKESSSALIRVPISVNPRSACFNRQIGLCPGVCTGEISKTEYAKTIRNLRLFFEGKKTWLLGLLKREMKAAAKAQEFEKAGELKKTIFALQHIQDVALLRRGLIPPFLKEGGRVFETEDLKIPPAEDGSAPFRKWNSRRLGRIRIPEFRIEAYDLSHFGGKDIVGAMTVVEDGRARPSEYRLFKIRGIANAHETLGLEEMLRRRFGHPEWQVPQLVVVDGNEVQKATAEKVLSELRLAIPVAAVVKDKKHQPRDILGLTSVLLLRLSASFNLRSSALLANSEAHRFALKFQKKRRVI
ncbi:MAG: Excinuclease ABC subunit C [Parcubacteria group bacterium GW2011_GWA2_49_9]|nr:MAG: Excinuclease ABC subunit C [Parcubacteria group bacterium GW2011_GWA2_49_9]